MTTTGRTMRIARASILAAVAAGSLVVAACGNEQAPERQEAAPASDQAPQGQAVDPCDITTVDVIQDVVGHPLKDATTNGPMCSYTTTVDAPHLSVFVSSGVPAMDETADEEQITVNGLEATRGSSGDSSCVVSVETGDPATSPIAIAVEAEFDGADPCGWATGIAERVAQDLPE
ncbi:DUF3558 family protein [Saccharomonospora sp. CUA-673]|uniref:DUF3558 family protein n=1 Tax=Saccharomonospora sp. CUA-673 TaxID=1904969 RepID=UPI0013014B6A|nr:DUF3558 family protein [Saccharomonospora sp. CUA-673]